MDGERSSVQPRCPDQSRRGAFVVCGGLEVESALAYLASHEAGAQAAESVAAPGKDA